MALAVGLPPADALGQGIVRSAPRDVQPGRITVGLPPVIELDDKPDRLSPGARIRDLNNMLVLPATLAGRRTIPVVYRRDAAGLVHEVWILTEAEYEAVGGTDGYTKNAQEFARLLNQVFGLRR